MPTFNWTTPTSSVGRGGTQERSPEIRKFFVEIWCYLQWVWTFRDKAELQEILSKKLRKCQFSIEILIKNSQSFLENFQSFLHFCANRLEFCRRLLNFSFSMGILPQFLMVLHLSTNFSRFSPNISRIFMPFSIVLLYLSYFGAFLINISTR